MSKCQQLCPAKLSMKTVLLPRGLGKGGLPMTVCASYLLSNWLRRILQTVSLCMHLSKAAPLSLQYFITSLPTLTGLYK